VTRRGTRRARTSQPGVVRAPSRGRIISFAMGATFTIAPCMGATFTITQLLSFGGG